MKSYAVEAGAETVELCRAPVHERAVWTGERDGKRGVLRQRHALVGYDRFERGDDGVVIAYGVYRAEEPTWHPFSDEYQELVAMLPKLERKR